MSLSVLKSGVQDTIQDRGRFGYAHLGINRAGAMDTTAMAVSNMLVGNRADEAVLEMHFPAPEIRFNADARIALSGGDFSARVSGNTIRLNTPLAVRAGAVLTFGAVKKGARCYLAVRGGFVLEPWLGSYSTLRVAEIGGFKGRALQHGDILAFRESQTIAEDGSSGRYVRASSWSANTSGLYPPAEAIRFCAGPEFHWLKKNSGIQLEHSDWHIGVQSNRMGYRMTGPVLQARKHPEMVSSVVTPGTIQLLPDGQLIVLMADCQTTGGYPRIGVVISADIPGMAQKRPGQTVRFRKISHEQAFEALQAREKILRQLHLGCIFRDRHLDDAHRPEL